MRKTYQGTQDKSKQKFEVIGKRELLAEVPLPMIEVWEELQTQVEQLTGEAGLRIIGAILENEVTRRVGPPHRPGPTSGAVRWGHQSGYVMFGGQKVAVERPRVRTREGQEVELDSYARLQHDGRRQRAVREGIVAGLTSRNYRRAVQSVVDGYGIEKSSVSREFVAASAAQLQELCEKKLEGLDLVTILIDGIHLGQQVLVVALGLETSGEKHVLGLWQGATENTTVVKELLEDLVARGLDPDFDIWQASRPVVERFMLDQFSPQAKLKEAGESLTALAKSVQRLPDFIRNTEIIAAMLTGEGLRLHPDSAREIGRAQQGSDRPALILLWLVGFAAAALLLWRFL